MKTGRLNAWPVFLKSTGIEKSEQYSYIPNMNFKKDGARIRQTRLKRGLSQESVAEFIGVSRMTLIRIEQGKTLPRYDKMVKLKKILQLET